jgi:hypothetical protein
MLDGAWDDYKKRVREKIDLDYYRNRYEVDELMRRRKIPKDYFAIDVRKNKYFRFNETFLNKNKTYIIGHEEVQQKLMKDYFEKIVPLQQKMHTS